MGRRNAGFTLVELAIASALLALLVGGIYSFMHGASDAFVRDSARQTLQDNARRILDEMTAELRDADRNNFLVTGSPNTTIIRFRRTVGFDPVANAPTWSGFIEYRYEVSPVDANNNGVADEGRVVRQGPNVAGVDTRTVLCDYVQAGGFSAVRNGDAVDLSVTLLSTAEGKKKVDVTMTSSVALRNKP